MAKSTRQYQQAATGARRRRVLLIAAVAVSVALVAGAVIYQNTRPYEPPPFDETATAGEPSPPEGAAYGVGGASSEDGFAVGLASNWARAEDGSLPIWFTNPAENEVYLMLRIRRASDDRTIYESGLLRPGEYIESLTPLVRLPADPVEADVAIYSFDPENYQSLGTLRLSGVIG